MAAMLWLGHFPPLWVVVVGLITAFAGYTAVYALNDLVDHRVDRERISFKGESKELFHVDEVLMPHPVAQGMLSFASGLTWCVFWAAVALVGAWWLNPFCMLLFVISAALEAIYCKLLRVTHLKIIAAAAVKSIGGLAGVFAVNPAPAPGFVALLILWMASWEVGGQNIANDIVDMEDDARVSARTTLTVKGVRESVFRLIVSISMAVVCSVAIYWLAGPNVGPFYPIGAVILGWVLLVEPARKVYYDPSPANAASLFNKASYMPTCFLGLVVVSILVLF
jgi:4-hydroxybenzoate polyprenyltransferase